MRMALPGLAILILTAPAVGAPPFGASVTQPNGIHPESHGPTLKAPAGIPRRIPALVNGTWRMRLMHVSSCKRRYRSYNPRTDRYHAYSGAYRRCVI